MQEQTIAVLLVQMSLIGNNGHNFVLISHTTDPFRVAGELEPVPSHIGTPVS